MTMEIELDKRHWVTVLWEETRGDPAARALIFGEVLEEIEMDPPEDLKEMIEEDMIEDPPDDLYEKVEQDLIDDPPAALLEKAEETLIDDPPDKLRERIAEDLRETIRNEFRDQIEDLQSEIERLRERNAQLSATSGKAQL